MKCDKPGCKLDYEHKHSPEVLEGFTKNGKKEFDFELSVRGALGADNIDEARKLAGLLFKTSLWITEVKLTVTEGG